MDTISSDPAAALAVEWPDPNQNAESPLPEGSGAAPNQAGFEAYRFYACPAGYVLRPEARASCPTSAETPYPPNQSGAREARNPRRRNPESRDPCGSARLAASQRKLP